MKQAKIAELKNRLSRYLDYVRKGGIVRVFDRDRPVADIIPVASARTSGTPALDAILNELERKGMIRRAAGKLPPDFLTRKLPRASASVLEALLEERRENR